MKRTLALLFLIMFTALTDSLAQKTKMTITTSSEKALELYNKGISAIGNAEGPIFLQNMNDAIKEDPGFFMGYLRLAFNNLFLNKLDEFKKDAESKRLSDTKTIINT